jgi:Arc/MetJ-type ribon-helix-helix transcriptional regulator
MTIHLPKDVESSVEAAVDHGHFASVDEALAEAWRCLQRQQQTLEVGPGTASEIPDPVLGSMRDYADELDEIVADAMKRRQEEPWRVIPG